MNTSNVNVSSPDLLISRAAMVHNHWSVSCGVEVLSFTYSWSRQDGGGHRDRACHPGGDSAYGSGAWAGPGTAGSIIWVRWDDARYDGQDCVLTSRGPDGGLRVAPSHGSLSRPRFD